MPIKTTNQKSATTRDVTFSIRARANQKELIDKAVEALGTTRTDFMLEVACREAENILLDRRYFAMSEETFKTFTALLDSPPQKNEKLRKLLAAKAPWE